METVNIDRVQTYIHTHNKLHTHAPHNNNKLHTCITKTTTTTNYTHTCAILLRERDLAGEAKLLPVGSWTAVEMGLHGEVCVPADAMLTDSFRGEVKSNIPGLLPMEDLAGEAPSCWQIFPCCCWRKSRKRVTVTPPPPPPTAAPTVGLGAIGMGRVGVLPETLPPGGRSLMGVVGFLLPGEKSWRRAEPGEASCSRRSRAIGEPSPGRRRGERKLVKKMA